ncbi:vanz-like protein [Grosmannia clavigera kw1407]|uniref:Vanz-like protein n=1 Tax=Grosmannia clavigera (strain kw1407 / UAMH 11150) TaxID=655863 RepID=F0XNB7_GROCL|nr:vanz-like protein [Grosmannia clavigera kw1407]EFX00814.1 vanz-like protein [Grosmannia clavigera kw1407]
MMRIRWPFVGAFCVLLVVAGYAGLSSLQLGHLINDKLLHLVTFFVLSVVFYWIVDTNRRRALNLAVGVCVFGLGIGSEVLQAVIPNNGREFDVMDIAANMLGSFVGVTLCTIYHKRMLERKRLRRYTAVPGEDDGELVDGAGDVDVELGEGVGLHDGDGGVPAAAAALPAAAASAVSAAATPSTALPAATAPRAVSLEEELDNWDENAEDDAWGEADGDIGGAASPPPSKTKKHAD